ncbi:hypothetical protein B9Z55_026434 [Caenorhabditis nigoni]|uniref:Uncharacterized protein n=2 Tax=Caenorhabditis nigoni TaxID=1611254 RepID=A0A2G5T379_9PELO|nr:hypothetical protein B9Z55_026434 [Caenorhabditis nigoni]
MGCCSSRTEEERVIVIEEIESNGPQAQEPAAGADPNPAAGADPNPAAGANPEPANTDQPAIFAVGELPRAPWEPPREQIEMGNCAPQNAVGPAANLENNRPPAAVANLAAHGARQFAVINRIAEVGAGQPAPTWQPNNQEVSFKLLNFYLRTDFIDFEMQE